MAGRFFVLVICATCIVSIESEVGSVEKFNQLLLQFRKRLSEMQHKPPLGELEKNLKPLISTSNSSQVLVNQTDFLAKNDSFDVDSKNDTLYDENMSDEYVPTENTVNVDFSQSTQDNSSATVISPSPDVVTELLGNQTTFNELLNDSSSTDITMESSISNTKQTDLSDATSVSPLLNSTDNVTSSEEEELSFINVTVSDNSSTTFPTTINLASTTSSSKEVADDNTTLLNTNTENSEQTTENTNITIVTSSTEISEGIANLSISTEATGITDETELTTLSEESTSSVANENVTDVTTPDFNPSSSTKFESSSVEPKEITVTDKQTESSTKITDAVTSSVLPSSSTSEEQTHSTVADESNHIKSIYNPTITKVKMALSITFMVIAVAGFVVLVVYMVKKQRQSIPYEELSLEP